MMILRQYVFGVIMKTFGGNKMKRFLVLFLVVLLSVSFLIPPTTASADFNQQKPLALMVMKFTCGCQGYGSGVAIGPFGLLTAGHNLYCKHHGKGLKSCKFLFGATSQYHGKKEYYNGFRYTVYDTFKNGYSNEWDIGFVIFKYNLGSMVGTYPRLIASDSDLNDKVGHIVGYNSSYRFTNLMSKLKVESSRVISFTEAPSLGEGGPVYLWRDEAPYVVAVYTNYSNGKYYGRRFTQDIYNDMKAEGAFD